MKETSNKDQNIKIVGILNISPESFSNESFTDMSSILIKAKEMIDDGADYLDIGAQSTRPGSTQLSIEEELRRLNGVIAMLKKEFPDVQISIDSTRAEAVDLAIKEGANVVNDISGGRFDERMIEMAKKNVLQIVITHSKGTFESMHHIYTYEDMILELKNYFIAIIHKLTSAGIPKERIILDPGIGFSKNAKLSIEIIKRLDELMELALPIYIGLSRKKFIGKIIDQEDPLERDVASTLLQLICLQKGVTYIRTHNVKYAVETRKIFETFRQ